MPNYTIAGLKISGNRIYGVINPQFEIVVSNVISMFGGETVSVCSTSIKHGDSSVVGIKFPCLVLNLELHSLLLTHFLKKQWAPPVLHSERSYANIPALHGSDAKLVPFLVLGV